MNAPYISYYNLQILNITSATSIDTWREFSKTKIQAKKTASSFTAKIPNIQVIPSKGSSTQEAFANDLCS